MRPQWRKVRKNFNRYRARLEADTWPAIRSFQLGNAQERMVLISAPKEAYEDLFHAWLGFQLFQDVQMYLNLGFPLKESHQMAWKYLETYQTQSFLNRHFIRPIKVKHFKSQFEAKLHHCFALTPLQSHGPKEPSSYPLQSAAPETPLPLDLKYERALCLTEHSHQIQMIAQSSSQILLFHYLKTKK